MNKWYKERYFDSASWILENIEKLHISSEEAMILILIDYAQRKNMRISIDYLANKLNKTKDDIDNYLAHLISLSYLQINSDKKGLLFDISNLFDFEEIKEADKDSYDLIEDLLGKPLSPSELQKANDLINRYGNEALIEALRVAEAYRKHSLAYVEGVLRNNGK